MRLTSLAPQSYQLAGHVLKKNVFLVEHFLSDTVLETFGFYL
jgi:hypothetical protein